MPKRISYKSVILVAFQIIFLVYIMLSGRIISFDFLYLILILIASIPAVWAIILMNTKLRINPEPTADAKLISSGPYRFVRHPMYATVISLSLIWIVFDFTYVRFVVFILLAINMLIKIYYEENILLNSLQGYKEYVSKSKRIIPFIF